MRFDPLVYRDEFCEIRKLPNGMFDIRVKIPEGAEEFWALEPETPCAEGRALIDREVLDRMTVERNP